jgi:hypothetical protein
MAGEKSGEVSMIRDGVRYTGSYLIDNDVIKVTTETGSLTRPLRGLPAKEVASQLLAKIVHDEIKSLK